MSLFTRDKIVHAEPVVRINVITKPIIRINLIIKTDNQNLSEFRKITEYKVKIKAIMSSPAIKKLLGQEMSEDRNPEGLAEP